MPERPLLMFHHPTTVARYRKPGGGGADLVKPTRDQQGRRLDPQFEALTTAFDRRRLELQPQPDGVLPEMALVFETRGSVTEFFKAVNQIPEMEWLAELENEFLADDLFRFEDSDKDVRGKVYFVMSNHQGLTQLLSLWNNYYKSGLTFPRGFTKWRDMFDLLFDVRPWGVNDRLAETGLLEDWQARLEDHQESITFEVELWFRKSAQIRTQVRQKILNDLQQIGGVFLKEKVIDEIAYHAVIVTAPIEIFNNLNANTNISLLKANEIMFLRPVGQCSIKIDPENLEDGEPYQLENRYPDQPPIVALLDGLPIQNHAVLSNRLIVDDVDGFEDSYPAGQRYHGTAMASLIIHGDLNAGNDPIKSRLYVRPIMRYFNTHGLGREGIPAGELMVDVIHRAVRDIFERGPEDQPPAYSTVKIINLSIGDPARVFDNAMSACARLLDWLSVKYNVLFIVSAGNCEDDLEFELTMPEMRQLCANPAELTAASVKHLFKKIKNRKIIAPAESINSITVGSCHADSGQVFPLNGRINVFDGDGMFSPISRFGLGFRRSIKPDLLMPGGRVLFTEPMVNPRLKLSRVISAPGMKVASPSDALLITNTAHTRGTSNSTALLSRTAAKLHEALVENYDDDDLLNKYFPVIAKSLLVHGTSWNSDSVSQIDAALVGSYSGNQKDLISRFLGYGVLNDRKIIECTEKRVTLIGFGDLSAEEAHVYSLPLPVSISGITGLKRLSVTLAWFSPVTPQNQIYRNAKLWVDFAGRDYENLLSLSRKYYDHDTVNRGTVQHEIFEGDRAAIFRDGASLNLRVNCKEDAGSLLSPVKYSISVTLEVDDALEVDIYNEIRLSLRAQVQI